MKKILFLLIIFIFTIAPAQDSNALNKKDAVQIKTMYSMDYKLPFIMRIAKKWMPKESVLYSSKIGHRIEIDISIMGSESSTIYVENYNTLLRYMKNVTVKNDSIIETLKIKEIKQTEIQEITIGDKTKEILGYKCVNFIIENDTLKSSGFLTQEISGLGVLITGKDHGLPLEYEETNKNEKITIFHVAKEIVEEPLNKSLFIISSEK